MSAARNPTEVLKAAKWIIEHVGWHQGNFSLYNSVQGKDVAFCALGAVNKVEGTRENRVLAKERLGKALPKSYRSKTGWGYANVALFNDNKKTTKKMVLALFDRAIKGDK